MTRRLAFAETRFARFLGRSTPCALHRASLATFFNSLLTDAGRPILQRGLPPTPYLQRVFGHDTLVLMPTGGGNSLRH